MPDDDPNLDCDPDPKLSEDDNKTGYGKKKII
jgi:hypothetical protein